MCVFTVSATVATGQSGMGDRSTGWESTIYAKVATGAESTFSAKVATGAVGGYEERMGSSTRFYSLSRIYSLSRNNLYSLAKSFG
jgi:hypothetical protein